MIRVVQHNYDSAKGMTREVYEIDNSKKMNIYINGELHAKQVSDFEVFKEDWNRDNVIYELYGAFFIEDHADIFYTPDEIIELVTDKKAVIEYV